VRRLLDRDFRKDVLKNTVPTLVLYRCDHLRRRVTQAERLHRDQRAIMCLKRDPQVQLKDAICSKEQPVCAPLWQDGSSKARPIKVASVQRHRSTRAVRDRADRIGNFAPVGVSQQLTLAMTLRLRSRDLGLRLGVTCDRERRNCISVGDTRK
jgi:hypothetical protein